MYEKEQYKYVGKSMPKVDGVELVSGSRIFTADIHLPGMLYAAGLLSSEHHALLLDVDVSEAERLPGVRAVITAKDVPCNSFGIEVSDQPALAEGKVRYKGEPIAVVAADTEEIAREAVRLIKVKYQRLPAVFDPRQAMCDDAPIIHEEEQGKTCKGNILYKDGHDGLMLRSGDIERGFAESDLIIEERFATTPQKPASIENHVALAKPEGMDKVVIWSANQQVFTNSPQCARILQMPLSKVRMISPAVGGGFGGKNDLTVEPMVALLAMKTGRPVRWNLTAAEDFLYATTKHAMYHECKVGVKYDGTLVALQRHLVTDAGAYRAYGVNISKKSTWFGCGPYRIPHQWVHTHIVYTNKQTGGSFRGFGMSQPAFANEVLMDIVAERVGLGSLEFRLKNCFVEGDRLATGQVLRSVGIQQVLELLKEKSSWGSPITGVKKGANE